MAAKRRKILKAAPPSLTSSFQAGNMCHISYYSPLLHYQDPIGLLCRVSLMQSNTQSFRLYFPAIPLQPSWLIPNTCVTTFSLHHCHPGNIIQQITESKKFLWDQRPGHLPHTNQPAVILQIQLRATEIYSSLKVSSTASRLHPTLAKDHRYHPVGLPAQSSIPSHIQFRIQNILNHGREISHEPETSGCNYTVLKDLERTYTRDNNITVETWRQEIIAEEEAATFHLARAVQTTIERVDRCESKLRYGSGIEPSYLLKDSFSDRIMETQVFIKEWSAKYRKGEGWCSLFPSLQWL